MMKTPAPLSPAEWDSTFSRKAELCSGESLMLSGALLRSWRDTAPRMVQPTLTHHYLTLHTGGPKRVRRRCGGTVVETDVAPGAITLASAGTAYTWNTAGPIGFVHLYLAPAAVDHVIVEEFDRDPARSELVDYIGLRRPLLEALLGGLTGQLAHPTVEPRLLLDTMLHHVIVQLVAECSTFGGETDRHRSRHAIAPRRLHRVLDYIEANLGEDIGLAELATIAGSSRFHFSRAFRSTTGSPPYRYLIQRRIEAAKALLLDADMVPIEEIARRCGFHSRRQFEIMFRRHCNATPARYRRER